MRRLGILFFAPALLATEALSSNPDVAGAERIFETWMSAQIAYRNLPWVAVGVVSNQQLVWSKGFGFADIDAKVPMTAATKFRMASHSKLFTSTAIMQLRDQGKVRLDDPVSKYLPWFKVKPAKPDDPPIPLKHLPPHRYGLSPKPRSH